MIGPYQYLLQIKLQLTWLQVHPRLENSLFQNLHCHHQSFGRPLACIALPQDLKKGAYLAKPKVSIIIRVKCMYLF
jgi:hypothetical protein